jgi:mannose-6-phosphate isomerase-like protein (cupin superfamily)
VKHGKVWGETELVFTNGDTCSVHILRIRKGGHCSEHQHLHKSNVFVILSGRLEITQWPKGTDVESIEDITILGPDETTDIHPGIWHTFRALEDTVCIELYHGRLFDDDIKRRTQGGVG